MSYTDNNFQYSSLSEILEPELIDKLSVHLGLELDGINFRIIEKQEETKNNRTLFSALSQALSANATLHNQIHSEIANYITSDEQWSRYKSYTEITNIVESIEENKKKVNKNTADHKFLYTNYTFSNKNKGLMVELCAAAEKFHFTFGVVVLHGKHKKRKSAKERKALGQLHVYNCENPDIVYNSHGVKYYFLQLGGEHRENWEWFYIQPYKQLYEIANGVYPARFKKVFQFKIFKSIQKAAGPKISTDTLQPDLIEEFSLTSPLVFHYNGQEYFYRKTTQDDETLFSILNHALFDKTCEMRLQIQRIISAKRKEINFAVHPGPQRNKPIEKQSKQTIRNQDLIAYRYFKTGDFIDLRIASALFSFTFNCFGMDNNGNLFHFENIKHKVDRKSEVKHSRKNVHLNLFVVGNARDFIMKWYRLELSPTLWSTYNNMSPSHEYKETTSTEEFTDTTATSSLPSDFEYVTSVGKETGDSDYSKVDPESNNVSESSTATTNNNNTTNNTSSTAETSKSSSESSSSKPVRPTRSLFKSIPIFSLMQQKNSRINRVVNWINSWLFPNSSSSTTKILLLPKYQNQEQNKIYEADKKTTSILKGNIPWFTSIPDSDYYMLTVDKSRPSTYLPLFAFQRADKDDFEETIWSPLYQINQDTSSEESSEELDSSVPITEESQSNSNWSDADATSKFEVLSYSPVNAPSNLKNIVQSQKESSSSRTSQWISFPLNTVSRLGRAIVSGYRGLFRMLVPRRRNAARVEPSKEHLT